MEDELKELSYMKAKQNLSSVYGKQVSLYDLMTDPAFIKFNDWLQDKGIDFQKLPEQDFNMQIAMYSNEIQRQLIDWHEAYKNAD